MKTDLHTATTDENGNVDLYGNQALTANLSWALVLGSRDPHSKQFATNEKGLQDVKRTLESIISIV